MVYLLMRGGIYYYKSCDRLDLHASGRGIKSTRCMADEAFAPWLYFWDDRDGVNYQGWWIAPDVGSQNFMAFSNCDLPSPELCRQWHGGGTLISLTVYKMVYDGGESIVMAVRAPGNGVEGAYQQDIGHAHRHRDRPVYRRFRELTPAEVAKIDEVSRLNDQYENNTEVVTYSHNLTLDALGVQSASSSTLHSLGRHVSNHVSDPVVGVSVGTDVQSVLNWVNSGAASSGVVQGVLLQPSAAAADASPDAPLEAQGEDPYLADDEEI